MELHERIAAARKAANLTQEQLGERVNVTRQAVSKWESGQAVPDALTLGQISRALGVSSDYLLFGEQSALSAPATEQTDLPVQCPCCGRDAPGNLCTACGYPLPSQPERGPRYALLAKKLHLVMDDREMKTLKRELLTCCGIPEEAGQAYLEQLQDYGTQVVLRRGLSDTAARWIAAHLDRDALQLTIVEDCGESEEQLVAKGKAMELPPVAREDKSGGLGFGGTVLAVIVGLIAAIVILSFL